MIILHYTGMRTAKAALERLCDPDSKVSAHYVLDEEGRVFQLVEDEKRAWHAGASYWGGARDINSLSIGIELVNPGHEWGYRPFPETQIRSLKDLCHALMRTYAIPPARILGHSDVAPSRKTDPGELFPWRELALEGIGIWPEPQSMDMEAAPDILAAPEIFHELLIRLGYDPAASVENIVTAFHRHFQPEKFLPCGAPEKPDETSAARILALLRNILSSQEMKLTEYLKLL
jgi:N-acetylmuramoyl-L-alanine amidase